MQGFYYLNDRIQNAALENTFIVNLKNCGNFIFLRTFPSTLKENSTAFLITETN